MTHADRRTFLKASVATGIAGLSGCIGGIGGGSVPEVNVGWIVPGDNAASLLRIDSLREEIATAEGSEYELVTTHINSTPQAVSALAAGELDMTSVAFSSFPRAVLNDPVPSGITAVVIEFVDAEEGYFSIPVKVSKDSDVQSAEDLKGKNLGVNAVGTGVQAIMIKQLTNVGLTSDDVNWVEIPFPAMGKALSQKRIDTAILPPVFAVAVSLSGNARTLFDSHDAWGHGYPFAFQATSGEKLDQKEDAIRGYIRDHVATLKYMEDPANADKIISALSEEYGIPANIMQEFFPENDYYRPPDGHIAKQELQSVVDGLAEIGFLEQQVDVASHIDNSYLP